MKLRRVKGTKISLGNEIPPEVVTTVRLISKKWAVPIMYHLYQQNLGFSDLKREIGLSSTVLSRSLEELQESALVDKQIISTSPIRVEYSLTILGSDFCDLVMSLKAFGEKYLLADLSDSK